MSTIAAVMRRSYTADMFDDLAAVPHLRAWDKATGVTTLTFDGVLDENTTHAIRARMESTDDTDQASRTGLRVDRDALTDDDPLRRLYDYVLGDAGL